MFGHMGNILNIDVTKKEYIISELPEKIISQYIGGAAINAYLLFNMIYPGIDPLGSDNPLIIGGGPIVGLPFPTAARSTITSVSPLTGIFGDSNGGGKTGTTFKKTGFDHIVIKGQSAKPCYLVIDSESGCSFEDASDIWGMNTEETIALMQKRYPKSAVLAIGPAGENLVKYAGIFSNSGTNFSRAGMGTVMGSKRIKAIIAIGQYKPAVFDPDGLKEYSSIISKELSIRGFPRLFKKYGTAMFFNVITSMGMLYGENNRRKLPYNEINSINVGEYLKKTDSKNTACFRCPLACRRAWTIKEGAHAGEHGHGFDVAHLISFGSTLGLRDIPSILHLIRQANLHGIDLNEFCGTLGMAIDAYQQGIINRADTGGIDLKFGDAEMVEKILKAVAFRNGIGDILGEGTKKAAELIGDGAKKFSLHMKGMHWPAHSAPPFTLAFSVSTRGGDFLKGNPFLLLQPVNRKMIRDLFGGTSKTMNVHSHDDKGRAVWWHENYKMINDSLGICFYLSMALLQYRKLMFDGLSKLYTAATGRKIDGRDLFIAGERGYQIERSINTLLGVRSSDDNYTRRPEQDSWAHGFDLKKKGMLDEYYLYRGLDCNGITTEERYTELGMTDVAEKLNSYISIDKQENNNYMPIHKIMKNPVEITGVKGLMNRLKYIIQRKITDSFIEDVSKYINYYKKKSWK